MNITQMFLVHRNFSYLGSLDLEVLVHLFLLQKETIDRNLVDLTYENIPERPGKPGAPSKRED